MFSLSLSLSVLAQWPCSLSRPFSEGFRERWPTYIPISLSSVSAPFSSPVQTWNAKQCGSIKDNNFNKCGDCRVWGPAERGK